jgi:hypothetical protein
MSNILEKYFKLKKQLNSINPSTNLDSNSNLKQLSDYNDSSDSNNSSSNSSTNSSPNLQNKQKIKIIRKQYKNIKNKHNLSKCIRRSPEYKDKIENKIKKELTQNANTKLSISPIDTQFDNYMENKSYNRYNPFTGNVMTHSEKERHKKNILQCEALKVLLLKLQKDEARIDSLCKDKIQINTKNTIEKELEVKPTTFICIKSPMKTLDDLIKVGDLYDQYKEKKDLYFNIDLKVIYNLRQPMIELQEMIGMNNIKESLCKQILFYTQNLESSNNDYLHSRIVGNPGVGKTHLASILGKLYCSMGFLKTNEVVFAKRDDFIGGYMGQTAIKTRKFLDSVLGKVLVIDESQSLGDARSKKDDSYAYEFANLFNMFLSEHRNDFVCLILGYKDDIKKNLFSMNAGLESRFPHEYTLNDYKPKQLKDILINKIEKYEWKWEDDALPVKYFNSNKDFFKANGRSMESLFQCIKWAHSERVIYLPPEKKKIITIEDFQNGIEDYKKKYTNSNNDKSIDHFTMYS